MPINLLVEHGIWAERLKQELEAERAEKDRLQQFFLANPSASAFSIKFFPKLPFLFEMEAIERAGLAGYIESMSLGSDE